MINSLEGIEALLRGTELESTTKIELDIPESSSSAFAIKVSAENSLRAWNILRSLVDETERYPVLAGEGSFSSSDWAVRLNERDLFSRREFRYEVSNSEDRNCSLEAIIERSKRINLVSELEQHQQRESWFSLDEVIDIGIQYTSTRFGIAPSKEAVLTAFQPRSSRVTYSAYHQSLNLP